MDYVRYGVVGRNWCRWCHVGVIVNWFRFMRRNHPRFGAQIAGCRNDRNAAVMSPVATRPVAASGAAAVVVRLLRLAHVLRGHSGHDTVVAVVWFPAMLLVGQWYHVGWSQRLLVMVAAGRDTRMMVVSCVVVDPGSLGWNTGRWKARQMC